MIESKAIEVEEDEEEVKSVKKSTEKELDENSKKVHGKDNYIEVKIPKLSAVILKLKSRAKEKVPKKTTTKIKDTVKKVVRKRK